MNMLITGFGIRWPFYVAAFVCYGVAFGLAILLLRRRKTGWQTIAILYPWLVLSILYAAFMMYQAWLAHGDPPPAHGLAWLANVVHVACGLSVSLFLGARLWMHGL